MRTSRYRHEVQLMKHGPSRGKDDRVSPCGLPKSSFKDVLSPTQRSTGAIIFLKWRGLHERARGGGSVVFGVVGGGDRRRLRPVGLAAPYLPQQAQEQADGQEEADPGRPEVAEDAVADAVVEDAYRGDGRCEQQLDGQDAVHLADEPCMRVRVRVRAVTEKLKTESS